MRRVHGVCRICGWTYDAVSEAQAAARFRVHYLTAPSHADATTTQLRERAGLPSWP